MAAQKRRIEETSSSQKPKKARQSKNEASAATTSTLTTEEVDFPRGGGTTFTPLEVKTIRAEAAKEAEGLFDESSKSDVKKSKKSKRKSEGNAAGSGPRDKGERIRIEHLNYKRLTVGMKLFGQIVSIQPLALVVSLPNQIFGHIPITNISTQFTTRLESMDMDVNENEDDDSDSENDGDSGSDVPELSEIFSSGQYIRTVVTALHAAGTTGDVSGISKSRDETVRASRRVELSLVPERVNAGVQKSDLKTGFTLAAAVKSVEDHGYLLELGVPDVSGFLPFKEAKSQSEYTKLRSGQLVNVSVIKLSANGRSCEVTADLKMFTTSSVNEISNVTSILPGSLVQALITTIQPTGLNLQVLGFFDGTVDQSHLPRQPPEKGFKVGKKVKARVLYDFSSTPPRLALSLNEHVINLDVRRVQTSGPSFQEAYPLGMVVENAKVVRVEPERGLFIETNDGVEGFVHISTISDDHLPSLSASSGSWKVGTIHRARVTGYFPFDGLLQLSLKPSVLEQKYMQIADAQVGEIVKGTVKKLTDSGLFITLSGNLDGVVWPNHYADITLKHPAKRFRIGSSIKCRVLVVDAERRRISLTAKKTLLESTLPLISSLEDAEVGKVSHAVVFKVNDKSLMVEFYNNIKAAVPLKEVSEEPVQNLGALYPVGKVVKVRVLSVDKDEKRILASIRHSGSNYKQYNTDISGIEIGNIVEGIVAEVHKDNAVLSLQPSNVRALISMNNLANHRGLSPAQLQVMLKVDEKLDVLVVVSRNTEKGFVIVANKPKAKPSLSRGALSIDTVEEGQIVGGRVVRHARHGVLVKLPSHLGGVLHPTDVSDDFSIGNPFPAVESILKAAVVSVDRANKQLTLSTRHSRMYPNQNKVIVDREVNDISDLHVGETVRGFIKSVAEHGLFVTIGRGVDARVQIKELFDDFVKDWKPRFQVQQLVKGRILSVDPEGKKVEMTFRSGDLNRARSSNLTLSDLSMGQIVDGIVKKVEEYGLFIQIENSKLSGLCHKSELSDNKESDTAVALRGFREGDRVKAYVLKIENRRISFSLKPSNFSEEDFQNDEGETGSEEETGETGQFGVQDTLENDEEGSEDDEQEPQNSGPQDSKEDEADDDPMDVDVDVNPQFQKPSTSTEANHRPPSGPLQLGSGFQWFADSSAPQDDELESSDESGDEAPSKKKKKKKEIEQDLTADMDSKAPESTADFERLLLGSPNSSYMWIQYMSFQLQLSEIDKAREIGRRALQTISFREEGEKLNVWTALLNLENAYGTDDSLEEMFKEAARANDAKTINLRLAAIFDQSEKPEKAEEQYKRTCKKFGLSSKVWTLFSEHYLRRGEVEESRKLLPRALQRLEKRKHLETISRSAQLEYKLGDPERGKTLFEGIVDSHPKRWDLWSVYIDMEAGQSNIQSIRNIFDRVLQMKMTSHKAKFFFKKWLELERRIGDEEGAENVKHKATEWTQRSSVTSQEPSS
ncbi:u3 snornp-associated protein rrp5 [Moniliophthora roreri MCA 2997]|uniref:U3 snornp-associated protein rrp5 n=1 Tax=Moniliophthora roreri (strain MCA 2997) TaxID=1381753 RepID=V2XZ22_MONRO|nr:u3 snornp-associated protein rrp5 [Moniliophthora roreri MCA 2997]